MRASPRATAMSERAWGWRPGHAWGLSCKLDATPRGPFHTGPCELSVALTSRQIGCWGFLGRQGVADPIHCEWPDSSMCEHSWRSCADVSLSPGASCACGLARSRSDPDRIVHTFPPHTSGSGSYRVSILFDRRFHQSRGTLRSPCAHGRERMLLDPGRTVHTSSRARFHTFLFRVSIPTLIPSPTAVYL